MEAFQYSDDCHQAQACLTCAISAERHLGVLFGLLSYNLGKPPTFRAFSESITVQICCMVSRRLLHSEMGSQVQCGEDSFPEFQVCLGMLHRTVICMGDNSAKIQVSKDQALLRTGMLAGTLDKTETLKLCSI